MHNGNQQINSPVEPGQTSEIEIQRWIVGRLAEELHVDRERIATEEPILSLGIDSVQVVSIMTQLEDWAGVRFDGNPLEDCSTIKELACLVKQMKS